MKTIILLSAAVLLSAATLPAQTGPVVSTSKAFYAMSKDDILRTAAKVPEELWSWQPTPEVRTFGQLFAHLADGQYEMCSPVTGKTVDKGIEKNVKGKAAITAALKEAFAYCDAVYAGMTDADAVTTVKFFGQQMTKIGVMDFNTAHNNEHYGNLVTYMRLKGIVPPSSEPRK
jgi:uncharacterized damage-inducible protein DinB